MSEVPAFMHEESEKHLRQSMQEHPELWIEAARFNSIGGKGREARIAAILDAKDIGKANSVAEWLHEVSNSTSFDLQAGGRTSGDNPDRPARAYYLRAAVLRLLELVGAPSALSDDLEHFLKISQPADANKRADLQQVLIAKPELGDNVSEIAKQARCSPRFVKICMEDGTAIKMPHGV